MKNTYRGLIEAFIHPKTSRFAFLKDFLETYRIPHEVILCGGGRHLLLRGRKRPERPDLAVKTLMAHYDRHPHSPGANDNSAAVVQLLLLAAGQGPAFSENTQILFTDREEVLRDKKLSTQGSWHLGAWLRRQRIKSWYFVNFDACGRGETPVMSRTTELWLRKKELAGTRVDRNCRTLRSRTTKAFENAGLLTLPTPLSDDLSLALHGYPSVLLTCLPKKEAEDFANEKKIPETWELINTKSDLPETLTDSGESFARILHTALRIEVPVGALI